MAVEWSGLGPELLLRMDRNLRDPLASQLQRELRDAIRSGRLRPTERLPSSRALAHQLGVSRGLVQQCYEELAAEGYLSTQPGSATRVAARATVTTKPKAPPDTAVSPDPTPRTAIDFLFGVPDLARFPMRDWVWALGEAGRHLPASLVGYGDIRGNPTLREILAAYLGRVRGSSTVPERLVVCTGFAQGVNLVLRALRRRGIRRVALEDPGDRDNDPIASRAGLEPVPIPVDDGGIDIDALAASGARAVVLTPAHQAPTGVALAPERRQQIVAWANDTDAFCIEDDYDAEFRYDRRPVGSLQGLAPDRVAAIGTVSKSLAPAVRLGWIACPPCLTDSVAEEKEYADRGSPGLDQLALAHLIESGRFDRHLRRMRSVYSARRVVLVEALGRHAPGIELRGLAAGFHAVARLPDHVDERAIISAASVRSVGLHGMSWWRSNHAVEPPELVLGFGNVNADAIKRGIAAVADLLTDGH